MTGRLYLADDAVARGWSPLTETMPAGEILFGAMLLRECLERAVGTSAVGYITSPELDGFDLTGAPPIVELTAIPSGEARVILSSRYVPPLPLPGATERLFSIDPPSYRARIVAAGSHVGWLLPPGDVLPSTEALTGFDTASGEAFPDNRKETPTSPESRPLELQGHVLNGPWEIVEKSSDQLARDLAILYPEGNGENARQLPQISGVERLGTDPVSAEADVVVDPGVVLDTRSGPIHLASEVRIAPFTHLRGPALIGPGSTLLGGGFDALSCGPTCNLQGEISESILLGYMNKAHQGYLGHSLIGRWVNLGAMTTNSDLKNNYGPVRLATEVGEVDTGLLKLGVFLGDHVKTGIGTTLNAGTIIGAGTNLFGMGQTPKLVGPFSWGGGETLIPYRLDAFIQSAEKAMGRRSVSLTPGQRSLFTRLWRSVHGDRQPRNGGHS